jgi:hypothetical protein
MNLAAVIVSLALAASGLIGPVRALAHPIGAGQSEPEKNPQETPPPSEPTAQPQPTQPPSEPTAQPAPAQPAVSQSEPAPAASAGTTTNETQAPKAPKCRKSKSGKCLKKSAATGPPKKIVVRNGSTSEPTGKLAPVVSTDVASQQAQVTEQLLTAAENNLKQAATRQLNADQTAVAEQIRNYIEQARAASKAGDAQRGHNLAVKAKLLSDDLVAH